MPNVLYSRVMNSEEADPFLQSVSDLTDDQEKQMAMEALVIIHADGLLAAANARGLTIEGDLQRALDLASVILAHSDLTGDPQAIHEEERGLLKGMHATEGIPQVFIDTVVQYRQIAPLTAEELQQAAAEVVSADELS